MLKLPAGSICVISRKTQGFTQMNTHITEKNPSLKSSLHWASDWEAVQGVVHDASDRALLDYLEYLLGNEAELALAAKRSHRHQLGFMKYVLFSDHAGRTLRLHVWDRKNVTPEDIHSHRVGFCSRIVQGRLVENSFSTTSGESHACFLYRTHVGEPCSAESNGRVSIQKTGTRTLMTGDMYASPVASLHNISDFDIGTMTISFWGIPEAAATVLKEGSAHASDCLVEQGISTQKLRKALQSTKSRIMKK